MKRQGWVLGLLAAGFLTGCAVAKDVTVAIRNDKTGEPMEDVRVEQYRKKGWLARMVSSDPFALVSSGQTDKDGKIVFSESPRVGKYHVFANTLMPIHFEVNGNGKGIEIDRLEHIPKKYVRCFIINYKDNSDSLNVAGLGLRAICWDEKTAYIGTYTGNNSGSKGIYRIRVHKEEGIVSKPELVAEVGNPSFLAFDCLGYNLYAVSESEKKVFAYCLGDEDGMLTLLNEGETGAGPCHVAVTRLRNSLPRSALAVADYVGGSMGVWSLERDGRIGEQKAFFQYTHASKATNRQQQPHAHGVTFFGDHKSWLLVPDLGADRVYVYGRDGESFTPHKTAPWIELPPGRGPRRVEGWGDTYLYVLNELSNTVSVFKCDEAEGLFTFVEEVGTLPEGFDGQNTTAELIVTWNTLYVTNRGHDSIARFRRDLKTGRLTLLECTPCGGKWPRHFTIMPGSSLMLVANQHSNNIALFRIAEDGSLTHIPDGGVDIGAPACVVFE